MIEESIETDIRNKEDVKYEVSLCNYIANIACIINYTGKRIGAAI